MQLYKGLNKEILNQDRLYPGQYVIHPNTEEIKEHLGIWAKSYVEDRTPPNAPITIGLVTPLAGTESNNAAPIFSGTIPASEENSSISIFRDNICSDIVGTGTVTSGAFTVVGSLPIDGFAVGANNFYVKVTDLAGNVSSCFDPSLSYVLKGAGLATLPKVAMVGNNSPTMVVALEDNNEIKHIKTNGAESVLGTFNKGDLVPNFNVDQGDKITSSGACYAITQGNSTAPWASEAYAGTLFTTQISRYGQFHPKIFIASIDGDAFVELKQNNSTVTVANVPK